MIKKILRNLTHSNVSTFQCFITEEKYFHLAKKLERSTMTVEIDPRDRAVQVTCYR